MHVTKAARRYAKALLEIAVERDELESTLKDIQFVKSTMDDSSELIVILRSPVVDPADKKAILTAIFDEHINTLTQQFMLLLTRKGREQLLHQITYAFIDHYNVHEGIIDIDVMTARALDDDQVVSFKKALEERTGKRVELSLSVDESLKGGAAVRIADTVIDGTVKHKLSQLEELLLESAV
ncbi:MAG: ATP synthase F1 subunit delta [Bacteroidota bacterium]|jgi:F-type H+-transporting ATPase subunit delta